MNCHHHDFVGLSTHSRGKQAMSEIRINHNTDQPLTTAYTVATPETAEQRQRRHREMAMAKANAVTMFYGGTTNTTTNNPQNLPVARPVFGVVQQPQTAEVTRAPAIRKASEPGMLALSGSFRKSSSSLMVGEELLNGVSNHSNPDATVPPPPPLKTEVTSILLAPPTPEFTAEVTAVVTNPPQKMPALKRPPPSSAAIASYPRRISDSVASISTTRNQYKERSSFQAHDSITSKPLLLPRKPTPNLYPSVPPVNNNATDMRNTNNEGGLLRGLAIEEQAQMLERFQQPGAQDYTNTVASTTKPSDTRTEAVQEQEKLWQQLSNSHRSINTATTAASSVGSLSPRATANVKLSPQEEQARLWEQFNGSSCSTLGLSGATSRSRRVNPLEKQAQLLEAYQTPKPSPSVSAVEEQERMLRAFQAKPRSRAGVDPIEEQAKRLREIQDAKERKVLEMACQISESPAPVPDRRDEEELSLQYIMEMSRREAEDHSRAQQDQEQAVLQEALQRSQQDLGLMDLLRQHEQSVDFELRRSIAELACQSSERTLESSGRHVGLRR